MFFDQPTPVCIAEISGNHGGDLTVAKRLLMGALQCDATFAKIQAYTADCLTLPSDAPEFRINNKSQWSQFDTYYNLYDKATTPLHWLSLLLDYGKSINLTVFASPFSIAALNVLESSNCPAYKIASPEITDIRLISAIGAMRKPVALSTGIANWKDVLRAVKILRKEGVKEICIMNCVSAYPASLEMYPLGLIGDILELGCVPGISDHTISSNLGVAAASMGYRVFEKHFNIEENSHVVDASFSSTGNAFKEYVAAVRASSFASKNSDLRVVDAARESFRARRSIFAKNNIKKGSLISENDLAVCRPGHGLGAELYFDILGAKVLRDVQAYEPIQLSFLELANAEL